MEEQRVFFFLVVISSLFLLLRKWLLATTYSHKFISQTTKQKFEKMFLGPFQVIVVYYYQLAHWGYTILKHTRGAQNWSVGSNQWPQSSKHKLSKLASCIIKWSFISCKNGSYCLLTSDMCPSSQLNPTYWWLANEEGVKKNCRVLLLTTSNHSMENFISFTLVRNVTNQTWPTDWMVQLIGNYWTHIGHLAPLTLPTTFSNLSCTCENTMTLYWTAWLIRVKDEPL